MKYWLLTLKWNNLEQPIAQDYLPVIEKLMSLNKQIIITDNCFEYDSHQKCHYHCIIATRYVHWKTFTDFYAKSGLHINNVELKTMEDVKAAQGYLRKSPLTAIGVELNAYRQVYKNNYMFNDIME